MPDRPLLATSDPLLLEALERLCAAVEVRPEVAVEVSGALGAWDSPALLVVGDDLAAGLLAAGPARRPDVLLAVRHVPDQEVWERASALGASVVALPQAEGWLLDRLATCQDGPAPRGTTVGVVGGRGGAGASTFAAALAVTGTRRVDTLLLDMDPFGGGLDLALGVEHEPGLRWPDLAGARGRVSESALLPALPRTVGVPVLSWDRGDPSPPVAADAARSVLDAARRSHGLVVADLPRVLEPAAATVVAACAAVLLVVPAEVRAVAAAARVAAVVAALTSDVRVVVRGPAPSGLRGPDVAGALGLPYAGWLRPEPRLAEAADRGEPPAVDGRGSLAGLCAALLDDLLGAARRAA